MNHSIWNVKTGADRINSSVGFGLVVLASLLIGSVITMGGEKVGMAAMVLPFLLFFVVRLFKYPSMGLEVALFLGFFASGLSRYVRGVPFGLGIDVILFLSWLALLFKRFRKTDWTPLKNDLFILTLIWFGYLVLELGNPEMRSATAWFYAMRGIGFYSLLAFGLAFMFYRQPKHLDKFLITITAISVLGTLWGFRQKIFGVDAAEHYWLYVEEHYDEHILFGVLRVFSFYSDAGQFGASQAMMALVCGVIALGPLPWKQKIFYAIAAIATFLGFAISGTRGAIMVPAFGGLMYLIVSRNFKILIAGVTAAGIVFYILKYTFLFQGVEQVKRMRTGLDPDNPSLNARLRNQVTFSRYLKTRPLGGGVGTAGYWGERFSPGTLLANTPTDSWYVKIWAETGIVGLSLHVFILGYVMGKGGNIVWNLQDRQLKYKVMGLYAGVCGIITSSYGNQIFGQMPTGMIMNLAIPMIFLAPHYDKILAQNKSIVSPKS